MNLSFAVTIAGIAAGGLLILVAVAVFWSKKEFSTGGVFVTALGFIMIGMSQWNSIKLSGMGIDINVVREQLAQTAQATTEVAIQAERAAEALSATQSQVASLTTTLQQRQVLSPTQGASIRNSLAATPRVEVNRLVAARQTLTAIKIPIRSR